MTGAERFWSKTKVVGLCIEWTGCVHKQTGYALFRSSNGKTVRAHRYLFELIFGRLPRRIDVRHTCDNRRCVALQHLQPGTRKQNMREAKERDRLADRERHSQAKLTWADVYEIRRRAANGETRVAIGADFGVCPQHIGLIVRGKLWKQK